MPKQAPPKPLNPNRAERRVKNKARRKFREKMWPRRRKHGHPRGR